jgi:carbonic anhydrase
MSITGELLHNHQTYAQQFQSGHLPMPPARKVAIVACMDARLTIEPMLGLKTGDAHILRNAGGIVTEDVLRSLLISHYLLDTQEFIVINHTDCGMLTFKDHELRDRLHRETGKLEVAPSHFLAFPDVQRNVREQILKLRSHAWIPQGVSVRGFVFDVKTGRLSEVKTEGQTKAA